MQEQISTNSDWREEISTTETATLKLADGENANFEFLNEGEKRTHSDFGTSIVFKVLHEEEEKSFYVNANNFDLLGQIKALGGLIKLKVNLSRVGAKKSDTRYTIIKVE